MLTKKSDEKGKKNICAFIGFYGYNVHKVPESSAPPAEKVTGDGENGHCLPYSPTESVAALQEITETPGVMVHLQVRGVVCVQPPW